ncbi:MAG TPA: hypothetical protein PLU82_04855, partial [Oscillospiraceae bacterium]|nr:hypothetical protein [Oscillospiraceae bacterium]
EAWRTFCCPFAKTKTKKSRQENPHGEPISICTWVMICNKKSSQNKTDFFLKTPFPFFADRIFAGESRKGVFFAVDLSGNFWNAMLCFLV